MSDNWDGDEPKDDGEYVETELEEDDDYTYEPVPAEIYRIIPESGPEEEDDEADEYADGSGEDDADESDEDEYGSDEDEYESDEDEYESDEEDDGSGEDEGSDEEEYGGPEPERAEILDFVKASAAVTDDKEEKNHESRLKCFIKSHIRDIITYTVVLIILSAAVLGGLYLRRQADRREAGKPGKRGGNINPAVELATPGEAERESTASPATAETADNE